MSEFTFENNAQRVSYGFGLQFGQQLLRNKFNGLNTAAVFAGIADIIEENKIQLSEEELNNAYAEVQAQIEKEQAEQAAKMAELGQTFLAENAKRDGVSVTESGLQYEVLEAADSNEKPDSSATVQVHYHGTFMDGTVFDSSVERGDPASFGVTQVIKGWTEALQLMNVGDKFRLVIPSDLAYGDAGAPPSIPGGAVLVFEVHLLAIV